MTDGFERTLKTMDDFMTDANVIMSGIVNKAEERFEELELWGKRQKAEHQRMIEEHRRHNDALLKMMSKCKI